MTTYAQLSNGVAFEIFIPQIGFTLAESFPAGIAALFSAVPDGTVVGSTLANGVWTSPSPPPAPPAVYPLLTPMQFYTSFSITERMKLKALALTGIPANGTAVAIPVDPLIAEIWATYQMSVSANAHIDPNLASTLEALEYLASPTAPTPAVIAADRIPQILAGIAQ